MQTVVLGSGRFDCLPGLLDRDPGGTPAVYVPTAADVLDERAYVQEEMHRLAGMGFRVTALPLAGASRQAVTAQLGCARRSGAGGPAPPAAGRAAAAPDRPGYR